MPTIEVSSKKLKTAEGYAYASHSLDQGAPVQSVRWILRHTYLHNTLPYTHAKQALISRTPIQ
ncbi:hypothetical protein [Nostoc sp.]|uniref:hypothetical protein n=1 Tax=Nostoc sp. TaxID=1180 RepID=UPI002FFB6873